MHDSSFNASDQLRNLIINLQRCQTSLMPAIQTNVFSRKICDHNSTCLRSVSIFDGKHSPHYCLHQNKRTDQVAPYCQGYFRTSFGSTSNPSIPHHISWEIINLNTFPVHKKKIWTFLSDMSDLVLITTERFQAITKFLYCIRNSP